MQSRVDRGWITVALVLLVGVVVLAAARISGNRVAFYAGMLVILIGVLTGIQRLIVRGGPSRNKR
jgi:hypothetical protein